MPAKSMQSEPIEQHVVKVNLGQSKVDELDALFKAAGLSRNPRGEASAPARLQLSPSRADELTPAVVESTVASNGVEYLQVPAWRRMGWAWHGFSTRRGGLSRAYCGKTELGDLNLGFTDADERENVVRNRGLFVEAVTGSPGTPFVTLRQFHSAVVVIHAVEDAASHRPRKADGMMTNEPGLLLGVQTADCIPVLVADRRQRAVAAFHAGWRGTVKRIVEKCVGRMRLEFRSRPEDLVAAIGPGIGVCCYAVGEEVLSSFESQFAYAADLFREVDDADEVRRKYPMLFLTQRAPGHSPMGPSLHVDLVEANRRQLLDAGLKPRAIHSTGGCTSCHRELFFSHRASRGHAGRMMSVIGIKKR